MATDFLFRADPYLTQCRAKVTSIDGNKIQVDRTCFYAFSGGQQSDSGTIANIEVELAQKDKDTIYYTLKDKPTFEVGGEVEIKIDKEKRDKIRKLHSAAHIVGDFFERKYNVSIKDIIGSSVEESKSRLDYIYQTNISEILLSLEEEVNNFLEKQNEISHYEKDGDKWEWKCGDFICPCGGTHVRNTKEIGKIKLKRKNIGSGKERIEIYLN